LNKSLSTKLDNKDETLKSRLQIIVDDILKDLNSQEIIPTIDYNIEIRQEPGCPATYEVRISFIPLIPLYLP
jgi:hypothetical protein